MRSWDAAQGVGARVNHLSLRALTANLEPGSWTALGGGGGALADGGPSSAASSSSFQTQELGLLMPGNVPWWPRPWDTWLQRNDTETTREFDTKLDVTPETNDISTSEVASRPSYNSTIFDVSYLLECVWVCVHVWMCALFMLAISVIIY